MFVYFTISVNMWAKDNPRKVNDKSPGWRNLQTGDRFDNPDSEMNPDYLLEQFWTKDLLTGWNNRSAEHKMNAWK